MSANNNLPIALTRFIGREKEIAEIARLIDPAGFRNPKGLGTRLLTLTGAGGAGKTRLAIQVARDLDDALPDGVWLIELASLADPALVPQTVATIFDLRASGNLAPIDLLKNFLRAKNLLLVLDNCEHLIDACARLAESLLSFCPDVKILATSREALNIAGEITFRVPSLALPNPQQLPPLEMFAQVEAIRLFTERARAAQPGFELTDANKSFIAQICARLDGMPLAIELAAARVKTLAVEQIAARLDDAFDLLTRGTRTAPTRQQTLCGAMDWSFDLLDAPERILFRRLAVFAGGWTLDAAEAIVGQDAILSHSVLDVLSRLVDKSLVNVETRDGITRYRMLETIRQYAREKLRESSEEQPARARQMDFFLQFAETTEQRSRGSDQIVWFDRLESEHDNLRLAQMFALEQDQLAVALRLATALARFWEIRGYMTEGRTRLEHVLTNTASGELARAVARAKAFDAAGRLAYYQSDYTRARALLEQGIELARKLDEKNILAQCLRNLGITLMNQDEFVLARTRFTECLELYREIGNVVGTNTALGNLGLLARCLGEYDQAETLLGQALLFGEQSQNKEMIAHLLTHLGVVAYCQKRYPLASERLKASLALFVELGHKRQIAESFIMLAGLATFQGEALRAARLFGAADSLYQNVGSTVWHANQKIYERDLAHSRSQLTQAAFNAAREEGRAMSLEQALAFALAEIEIPDAPAQSPRQIAKEKFDGLTAREREVAALIAQGKTNRDIADALVLSERTIEGHVGNILTKLDFTARAQIAAWAVEKNLLRRD